MTAPAARQGDAISHTDSAFGFGLGGAIGLAAGLALLTVATGGADLAVLAAIGGAVALTGGGALAGMNIGATYGSPTGDIVTGSPNVHVNAQNAARALADMAVCDDHDAPQKIATGSTSVFINGMPAARLGDLTICDARISSASSNVFIGGGTGSFANISPEVPQLAVDVAASMVIAGSAVALGAGGAAAYASAGWAGAGVFGLQAAGGIAGGAALGAAGKSIGGALDGARGAAWGEAIGGLGGGLAGGAAAGRLGVATIGDTSAASLGAASAEDQAGPFTPIKTDQTEPGAVPMTSDLQSQMDAANARGAMSAEGYPDLPAEKAQTFGATPTPWNGDDPANSGTISRVIGSNETANGGFWSSGDPATEADWRGGSAVQNNWNGNGASVQSPTTGLRGWSGPAAPQMSSDGTSVLPGGSQQIWIPPGSASPSAPTPTPWSGKP